MSSGTVGRRGFLAGTAGVGIAFVVGGRAGAQGSDGPYGPLSDRPDANGLLLADGFTSRIVARAGEPVDGTDYEWPAFPDGAATFPIDGGGWYQAVNTENPVPGDGGVSVIRYDADGTITGAYRVLDGTQMNCAGGPTPWGTWLSCEEHDQGRVWECDPTRPGNGQPRPALGVFSHEAVAVDPDGQRLYLTEDEPDGAFYRFTPSAWPSLDEGLLEVASVSDGRVTWYEVPDPAARQARTADQAPQVTRFDGGEGCWYADGTVWFTTKGNDHVEALDVATDRLTTIYRGDGALTGVDNITSEAGSGDLLVAEDGGDMQVVVITADGTVAPLLQVVAEPLPPGGGVPSEVTGLAFSPDGTRLYFASQRGGNPQTGISYEITGPFRGPEVEASATTTTLAAAGEGEASDGDGGGAPLVPIGLGVGAAVALAGGAVALRRRGQSSSG